MSTSAFKLQLLPIAYDCIRGVKTRHFNIDPLGIWIIASKATMLGCSLVIMGIHKDFTKREVATTLVVGME